MAIQGPDQQKSAASSDRPIGKEPRLRSVSELYDRHPGSDIYVVGTGTSLRVFPLNFFSDKITIGLNQAWTVVDCTYCITMMPRLNIPKFIEGKTHREETTWITKPSKIKAQCTPDELEYANEHFYGFENDGKGSMTGLDEPSEAGRMLEWVRRPHPDKLYLWTSISQTGMNLAANMGAKNIILVGCDNAALGENHHAHDQHTMWKGASPDTRYMEYYEGVSEVRAALRERNVNVVSMTPFVKLDGTELDFERLCGELNRDQVIKNPDIQRGTTLRDDNVRYLRLTKYIVSKNLKYLRRRVSLSR